MSTDARSDRRVRVLRALPLLLPALGLLELVLTFVSWSRAPAPQAWTSLREPIARAYRPGDLVVVAPRWAEPNARAALGDALMPLADVARSGVETYDRALEVSILGERAPDLASFREAERIDVGPFTLRVLENPSPEHVVFDFVAGLRPPTASAAMSEPPAACSWNPRAGVVTGGLGGHPTFPRERFECTGNMFFDVSSTVIADERFLPRRCVFAHPPETGQVKVTYAGVPLGTRLVGHTGMYWIIEREPGGAPVTLRVEVDGNVVGEATHLDGDGWKRFELPLGAHANKDRATVVFAVSSPDNMHRHFCFQADTR